MSRDIFTTLTLRCFVDGTCPAFLEVDTEGWHRSSRIFKFMMRWMSKKNCRSYCCDQDGSAVPDVVAQDNSAKKPRDVVLVWFDYHLDLNENQLEGMLLTYLYRVKPWWDESISIRWAMNGSTHCLGPPIAQAPYIFQHTVVTGYHWR